MAVDNELFDGLPGIVENHDRYFDYKWQLLERWRFHALSLLPVLSKLVENLPLTYPK